MVDTYRIIGHTGVWKLVKCMEITYNGISFIRYGIFVRHDGTTIFTDIRNAL